MSGTGIDDGQTIEFEYGILREFRKGGGKIRTRKDDGRFGRWRLYPGVPRQAWVSRMSSEFNRNA